MFTEHLAIYFKKFEGHGDINMCLLQKRHIFQINERIVSNICIRYYETFTVSRIFQFRRGWTELAHVFKISTVKKLLVI